MLRGAADARLFREWGMNKFWRFPVRPVERETRNKGSLATEMGRAAMSRGDLWEQQGKG